MILFSEEWSAFTSVAGIPSFKQSMVFGFAPRWANHDLNSLYGNFNERAVVVVKDSKTFIPKTGIQSRKNLVRFLLKNKFQTVPRITVHNHAELCLSWGGPAEGLHFIPPDKNSSMVCIISMRKDSQPGDRPEVAALHDMRKDYWPKAQFGWLDANEQPRLWEYLTRKAKRGVNTDFVLAAIDWVEDVTNVFEAQAGDPLKPQIHAWLEDLAKSDEWLTEKDSGPVPGLQMQTSGLEQLGNTMEMAFGGASIPWNDVPWGTFTMFCAVLFMLIRWVQNIATADARPQSEQRQESTQGRQQQQQQQQRQYQEQQSPHGQHHGSSTRESNGDAGRARAEQHSSSRPAANGSASDSSGFRHRSNASSSEQQQRRAPESPNSTSAADLEPLFNRASVKELREYAEKYRINIMDCSEKSEIVNRIISAIRRG